MQVENKYVDYRIEDGIMFIKYNSGMDINEKAAKKIVRDRLRFQDNTSYPIFCDVSEIGFVNREARNYLAHEGSMMAKAVVFYLEDPLAMGTAKMYLAVNKPTVPTRWVLEKEKGLQFLEKYK